ncbi:MAG: hypothetical protein EOM21_16015 [Gammaproteobacteria bacterium]|nr:hypothetical protein [Gammaproteobacteria bacterium]
MANNYTSFSTIVPMPNVPEKDLEDWLGAQDDEIGCEAFCDGESLWVRSNDGDAGEAADLIMRALERFDIDGCVIFEYANTCSKLRPGEFGGGAALISRYEVYWTDLEWFIESTRKLNHLPPVIN